MKYFRNLGVFTLIFAVILLFSTSSVMAQATAIGPGASANDIDVGVTGVTAGSTVEDNSTTNNYGSDLSKGRGFPIPGDVQYGPVLNYFGQPLPSEGFQPVEQLIMYSCWFTEGALISMLDDVEDVDTEFKVANLYVAPAHLDPDGETKWIKIVISRDKYEAENVSFKGFVTSSSDDEDTTMTEVMADAALYALQNDCNVIHFTAQGAVRDVFSSGWGVGLNTTQAALFGGGNMYGNVTSGGTGYSSARAGTRDLPWLQGFGLVDPNLVYPVIEVPAAE